MNVFFSSKKKQRDILFQAGNIEFDDSMSSRLLPNEKHRKKDLGTTSYKRPGPPTPSKNGGRVSLQGNDNHPLREQNESKTPKKSTPGRLKSFLMGRNSSVRDGTEVGYNDKSSTTSWCSCHCHMSRQCFQKKNIVTIKNIKSRGLSEDSCLQHVSNFYQQFIFILMVMVAVYCINFFVD